MNMRIHTWNRLSATERAQLLQRPAVADDRPIREATAELLLAVRSEGDSALRSLTARYDGARI